MAVRRLASGRRLRLVSMEDGDVDLVDSSDCMHFMVAVERLHNDGVPTRLAVPTCDREQGEWDDDVG